VTKNATDGAGVYDDDSFIVTVDSIETVDLVVNNKDDGDHPFHLVCKNPVVCVTAQTAHGVVSTAIDSKLWEAAKGSLTETLLH
jgi:hypothetical protein